MGGNNAHRGRLQIQGGDMNPETSAPWSQSAPKTAASALTDLDGLLDGCTKAQRHRRDLGEIEAKRFIRHARDGGGVQAPVSEWFPRQEIDRPKDFPDARIDIEVKAGLAFT
jgi:hypothetical protein